MVIITKKSDRKLIMNALQEYAKNREGKYPPSNYEEEEKEATRSAAQRLMVEIRTLHDWDE